ncbi:MAG: peptide deformylase [Candidatus Chisholmbacteria bacterium]|nr:peptide deformylase [Candidatus Chisholmbacteria bacterium]
MHPILTVPNPILRQKSKPVLKFDSKLEKLIKEIEETLTKKKNPQGVGLSAVQIGTPLRVFATYLPDIDLSDRADLEGKTQILRIFVNPQITRLSKQLTLGGKSQPKSSKLKAKSSKPILEGCLSIPGIYGPVKRHQWIKLEYQIFSSDGGRKDSSEVKTKVEVFSGFTARVIQHELDHLDGILFTDRALKQKLPIYEEINGKLESIELA